MMAWAVCSSHYVFAYLAPPSPKFMKSNNIIINISSIRQPVCYCNEFVNPCLPIGWDNRIVNSQLFIYITNAK